MLPRGFYHHFLLESFLFITTCGGVLLAIPGLLLSTLQCTGRPHKQRILLTQMSIVARNPAYKHTGRNISYHSTSPLFYYRANWGLEKEATCPRTCTPGAAEPRRMPCLLTQDRVRAAAHRSLWLGVIMKQKRRASFPPPNNKHDS